MNQRIELWRLLSALIVVISHLPAPMLPWLSDAQQPAFELLWLSFFNGTFAVLVFFVISGYCIHASYDRTPSIWGYYRARLLRIGLPLLAACLVAWFVPDGWHNLKSILWSLICELCYYLLYPGLRTLADKVRWTGVLIGAGLLSLALILWHSAPHGYFWEHGLLLTWAVCLPFWLLGVVLLERENQGVYGAPLPITLLRGLALIGMFGSGLLHRLELLAYQYTLFMIMPIFFFWLSGEFRRRRLPAWLSPVSYFAVMTYSVYLFHKIPLTWLSHFLPGLPGLLDWILLLLSLLSFVTLMYFLAEAPSIALIRHLRQRDAARQLSALRQYRVPK